MASDSSLTSEKPSIRLVRTEVSFHEDCEQLLNKHSKQSPRSILARGGFVFSLEASSWCDREVIGRL
ncbi:uncharacterized protein V6R79_014317 [Siganus canaliculatus]